MASNSLEPRGGAVRKGDGRHDIEVTYHWSETHNAWVVRIHKTSMPHVDCTGYSENPLLRYGGGSMMGNDTEMMRLSLRLDAVGIPNQTGYETDVFVLCESQETAALMLGRVGNAMGVIAPEAKVLMLEGPRHG